MPRDPLQTLPPVLRLVNYEFQPGSRLTNERWEKLKSSLEVDGFLWEEEIKILREILKTNEAGLAWDESMRGTFSEEYFPPIIIPVIEHEPWAKKLYPIPAGV